MLASLAYGSPGVCCRRKACATMPLSRCRRFTRCWLASLAVMELEDSAELDIVYGLDVECVVRLFKLNIYKAAQVWRSDLIYLVPCSNEVAMANTYMQIAHCLAGGRINTIGKGLKYRIIGNNLSFIIPHAFQTTSTFHTSSQQQSNHWRHSWHM